MKMTLKAKPLSAWLGRVLSRFPSVYEGVIRLAQHVGALPGPQPAGQHAAKLMRRTFDQLPPRAQAIHCQIESAIKERSGKEIR